MLRRPFASAPQEVFFFLQKATREVSWLDDVRLLTERVDYLNVQDDDMCVCTVDDRLLVVAVWVRARTSITRRQRFVKLQVEASFV